jgi:hypothetical protein
MACRKITLKEEVMFATSLRAKSNGKRKHMRFLTILLLAAVAVFFTIGDAALAKRKKKNSEELDEVNVFIEWNSSDEDHGIQFFWDSEGFTRMMVFNERRKKVLDVYTKKNIKKQGLTEVAIESVEPEESEQTREQFFRRFPAGEYKFWGRSIEGGWLYGEAEFTHDILEPVVFDSTDLPDIEWVEPEVDDETGNPLDVVGYEIVIELVVPVLDELGDPVVDEEGELEEQVFKETTTLPAGVTMYTVSDTFMDLIESFDPVDIIELKVEILAEEESGNKTITEEALIEPGE